MNVRELKADLLILTMTCEILEKSGLLLSTTSGVDFYAEVLELRRLLKEQIEATEIRALKENETKDNV